MGEARTVWKVDGDKVRKLEPDEVNARKLKPDEVDAPKLEPHDANERKPKPDEVICIDPADIKLKTLILELPWSGESIPIIEVFERLVDTAIEYRRMKDDPSVPHEKFTKVKQLLHHLKYLQFQVWIEMRNMKIEIPPC